MQTHEVPAGDFDRGGGSGPARGLWTVVAACDAADGVDTLSEQTRLELRNRGLAQARLWVAADEGGAYAAGFALARGHNVDIAVHPDERGSGIGTRLVTSALAGLDRVEAWSHADHPAARAIADRLGIPRTRALLVMSRPASSRLDSIEPAPGVHVRTFTAEDEAAVLRINSTAFAHHPEQGSMTIADFHERTAEPWFDPEGLFLAVDEADTVLGFHWTKMHRDATPAYGEVYVVAVDPTAAGRGIGTSLTAVGVDHLADAGVDRVILYVEGDNGPAIAVYTKLGFEVVRTEVQYSGPLS